MDDFYAILGISKHATQEEIQNRYRFLVKAYHPDRFSSEEDRSSANEQLKQVNIAYEVLSDPEKRAMFDQAFSAPKNANPEPIPPYRKPNYSYPPEQPAPVRQTSQPKPAQRHHSGICVSCGQFTEVKEVEFYRNIGALVIRFYKHVKGDLCAECVEKYFWQFTAVNLILGWWGIRSFFCTIFFIIANIVNYFNAWSLRPYSKNLSSIARVSKLVVFGLIGCIMYILFQANAEQSAYSSSSTVNSKSTAPVSAPTGTITKTPKSTVAPVSVDQPTCKKWSQISLADVGQTECVIGIVQNTYFGDDIFYINFSEAKDAFRLIVLQGRYYSDVQGNCVMAEGVIKAYGNMPYIEVGDHLYKCE